MKEGVIEQIKARITVPEYMQREHGSRITGGRCKSFRPDAKNASSLMVNERDWYDFGSGSGGDVIDLAAHDKFAGDKGAAIRYLAEQWGLREIAVTPELEVVYRSYAKIIDLASCFYHEQLRPEHINYLHGRGLTDKTIDDLRIGWAGNPCEYLKERGFDQQQIADSGILSFVNRLMVPYLRNGKAVYMIGRASVWPEAESSHDDAKYMKLYRNELSEHPIWGFESLHRSGPVVIAEGIFDAISCWQEDYPVVTAVTGAFSGEQKKDLIPALKGRDVIVCMDYDPVTKAGQKFTETLAGELFEVGIHVAVCLLSGTQKKVDLSDLYAMQPERKTLDELFDAAKNWEELQLERIAAIPGENEKRMRLTVFLRRCATCFDWPTVAQLIDDARSTNGFSDVWLRELAKILKQAPPDDMVAREFVQTYDCIFHESLGWYEYNGSRWAKLLESEVRQRIAKKFGRYRTSNRVNSVYQLLKGDLIYKGTFDGEPDLVNFQNGMLNLTTGKILPHSRDYFSAIQLDYSYDPDATCPLWNQFIEDITDSDSGRHNVLQEMFGYCFTKDSRYQKCFFLIGDGANGKSVLLTILKSLVSPANTSHVEIASLESAFERITLHNKLVNIASETKTDVRGTEAIFKQIVAGDPVSGCFKGKDFVTFTPFCKLIFAANEQLQARDISYGFLRRICFIRFPVRFVDAPNPGSSREKKKDPRLDKKLLAELPGIFNWSLTGLQELWKNDAFTVTGDQTELTKELVTMSNPLVSFVEDVVGNGAPHWNNRLSRNAVYKEYNDWCRMTNTIPMSARSFWPRLRQTFPFEEFRTSDGRFIEFKNVQK